MTLPEMRIVERQTRTPRAGAAPRTVTASGCTHADDQAVGQCFDQRGLIPNGKFNCTACCALRGAVGWHNLNTGAVVAC